MTNLQQCTNSNTSNVNLYLSFAIPLPVSAANSNTSNVNLYPYPELVPSGDSQIQIHPMLIFIVAVALYFIGMGHSNTSNVNLYQ